ncbi:polyprenyl synthetase family protein [Actinomadura rubrisoli]|uniref:Polyprenyl synthetase family protein n=1 Tax=Actinomadura rubrisoli TaxID=2530368 RepID=A0A4V2YQY6_9ACTN|nr:polyprenyl synthetase family protein [Actinomadura rubrisoli]TDD63937.1 polyprenyl synthetase family protein [Actinomadura rubrisoli]
MASTSAAYGIESGVGSRGARTVRQILADTQRVVEPARRAAVDAFPVEIGRVAGYHAGWWDAEGRPTDGAGKAVRPALALACARAVGGGHTEAAGNDAAVAAAVAVELVHDFSLLHDDVMDGDTTRRHRPAAWAVFGVREAILVGDALLAAAMQQVISVAGAGADSAAAARVLAAAVQELCEGQSADLAFEERAEISLDECAAMAEGKTGALLGAACQLGAMAGITGGSDQAGAVAVARYRAFGRHLGLAFQLVDDLLGIWGDPAVTGKPVGSDLLSRKKSLPVVAALRSGTSAGKRLAWLYQRAEPLDEGSVADAAELVASAGGRVWARAEADRHFDAAMDALTEAGPAPDAAADLRTLAELITRRDH